MIIIEAGGSVTIEENAILSVDASSSVKELNDILPWDNLDDYDVRTVTRHNGRTAWYLTYVPEATQLGTPTDLEWGVYYNETGWEYDPITGDVASVELEKTERSGAMSWKTVLPDQAWIQMKLYRVGEDTPVGEWRTSHNPSYQPEYPFP